MNRSGGLILPILLVCFSLGRTVFVEAGQQSTGVPADAVERLTGPAQVLTRDDEGRITIRAVRLTEGLAIDGRLDEPTYKTVSSAAGFVQQLPDEGAPATQKTEVWVLYDDANLYISARCWDSAPPSEWVANELRRDGRQITQNDTFGVMLDTFHDRRNGVLFFTNPLGALADQQITDERFTNSDWNPVWDVKTDRDGGGWTVEMQIPFKSLRYGPGSQQTWGIQLRRVVRRINEWSYITPVPISASGQGSQGMLRVSAAATLVGLEVPPGSKNIEVKPYGIFGATTDPAADPPKPKDADGAVGFDVKYGLTQNLTADFTYNTDFAQVEVDDQQVNLTRFNLFFPEKREFFLESRGIFDFGGGSGGFQNAAPVVFYSRRIGLEGRNQVPILGGARLTGKAGNYSIGTLSIQTDGDSAAGTAATNFTVARIKRDILRRSSIGGLFTQRSQSAVVDGSNQAYGLDGTFSFYENVNFAGFVAKTTTPGLAGRDTSYRARFDYPSDRYKVIAEQVLVGKNFNPEVGFLRRENFRRRFAEFGFTPRPRSMPAIRQFVLEANIDYTVTADTGLLETQQQLVSFEIERENSDRLEFDIVDTHERVDEEFDVSGGIIAPGDYRFRHVELVYTFGAQRPMSGSLFFRRGSFYGGDISVLEVNSGRMKVADRLSIEPSLSFNWLDLPSGSFKTKLVRTRASYSFSPRTYFSGLLQYNTESRAFSTNLRLRWEYRPGSEIFVVLTEERDIEDVRVAGLRNRGFVLKVNRLFTF